jgi:DNA-binding NarL/FixJ family response regulator
MESRPCPRRTLLVIDDDPSWRSLYRLEFGERFDVVEAADGRDGLEQLRLAGPDLVILDLRMPGMDGARFLACLEDRDNRTPVIVCTALEHEARKLARSDVRIVPKSPDLTRLSEAVKAAFAGGSRASLPNS